MSHEKQYPNGLMYSLNSKLNTSQMWDWYCHWNLQWWAQFERLNKGFKKGSSFQISIHVIHWKCKPILVHFSSETILSVCEQPDKSCKMAQQHWNTNQTHKKWTPVLQNALLIGCRINSTCSAPNVFTIFSNL